MKRRESERPHEKPGLSGHLDELEKLAVGLLGSPLFLSALALVTAGDRDQARGAVPRVARVYRVFVDEHVARRRAAGLGGDASPLAAFVRSLED